MSALDPRALRALVSRFPVASLASAPRVVVSFFPVVIWALVPRAMVSFFLIPNCVVSFPRGGLRFFSALGGFFKRLNFRGTPRNLNSEKGFFIYGPPFITR